MKLLTFLGTGNYQTTTYIFGAQECVTRFFPVAAVQFTQPVQTLVCVTPTVEKHANWTELGQQLNEHGVTYQAVPIPEGHSEANLWEIFDRLTEAVDEAEEVTFDITHSFRSLPILSLLAMAYLKAAKQVKVKQVLYGAWEAHDDQNRSPVFDLTPFVQMLDWLTATDRFTQTGDARRLAELLNSAGAKQGPAWAASQKLSEVSLAAFLCQPFTLMREAQTLEAALQLAGPELAASAHPFAAVRSQIVSTFGAFSAKFDPTRPADGLRAQFRLIEWYYRNNQLTQAMTLAREWLISAVTYRLGESIDFRREPRELLMERAISGLAMVGQERKNESGEKYVVPPGILNEYGRRIHDTWPECDQIKAVWNELTPVRNALDHAEHQYGPMALKNIKRNADTVMPRLRDLAQRWELA